MNPLDNAYGNTGVMPHPPKEEPKKKKKLISYKRTYKKDVKEPEKKVVFRNDIINYDAKEWGVLKAEQVDVFANEKFVKMDEREQINANPEEALLPEIVNQQVLEIANPVEPEVKEKNGIIKRTNPDNPSIVFIPNGPFIKDVEKVRDKLRTFLKVDTILIIPSEKLNDHSIPKTNFIAFNFFHNPLQANIDEINNQQFNISQICKGNCVFVALDRISPKKYLSDYYEQNVNYSGFLKEEKSISKWVIQSCEPTGVEHLITEKNLPSLCEQITNIYKEFADKEKK